MRTGGLVLTSLGSVIGGAGIGLVASLVASPAGIICSGIGVGLGGVSTFLGVEARAFQKKVEKHAQLYMLASDRLVSLNLILSKALADGRIDEAELKKNQDTIDGYKKQKAVIQKRALVDNEESQQKKNSAAKRGYDKHVKKAGRSLKIKIRWGIDLSFFLQ